MKLSRLTFNKVMVALALGLHMMQVPKVRASFWILERNVRLNKLLEPLC